eukprot:6172361-Pleurochrysis_carterae.AAC.1
MSMLIVRAAAAAALRSSRDARSMAGWRFHQVSAPAWSSGRGRWRCRAPAPEARAQVDTPLQTPSSPSRLPSTVLRRNRECQLNRPPGLHSQAVLPSTRRVTTGGTAPRRPRCHHHHHHPLPTRARLTHFAFWPRETEREMQVEMWIQLRIRWRAGTPTEMQDEMQDEMTELQETRRDAADIGRSQASVRV